MPVGLLVASWVPGHTWSEGYRVLLLRYAPWHIVATIMLGFFLGASALAYLPTAFLIPAYYWWAHNRNIGWPAGSEFIDGTIALAELGAGATAVGLFYLAVLL